MAGSSPLAFVRPQMPPSFSFYNDSRPYNPSFLGPAYVPQNSFNYRQPVAVRPSVNNTRGYFDCKPVRESSPTSGLAADLAVNFHIGQSPKEDPTPRRSLFPNNDNNNGLDFHGLRGAAVTPPIPTSSPGPDLDCMDYTPLPHKKAHQTPIVRIDSCLTPEITPDLDDYTPAEPPSSVLSSITLQRSFSQPPPAYAEITALPSRPRPTIAPPRPGFRRHGTCSGSFPSQPPLQPAFQFSCSRPALPALSRLETFAESPEVEKGPMTAPITGPTNPLVFNLIQSGSPSAPLPARAPTRRPRQMRRTQSCVVEPPTRHMKQEKRHCTDSSRASSVSLEMEECQRPRLPHFMAEDRTDLIPRVTRETFLDVTSGKHDVDGKKIVIIDCRFEYEYAGGHIQDAINFNDKELLAKRLFDDAAESGMTLIFHCEYSQFRAPKMAAFIREHDRIVNMQHYPKLSFPEVYVLAGGYSAFFESCPSLCFPQAYVEMDAIGHEVASEKGMAAVKQKMPRQKLARSATYAFGQQTTSSTASAIARLGGIVPLMRETSQPNMNMSMRFRADSVMTTIEPPADVQHTSLTPMLDTCIVAMELDGFSSPNGYSSPMQHHATTLLNRKASVPGTKRFDSF